MQNETICFFNSSKTWGGGEKWHFDMALELHKNNFNVIFFAYTNSELSKKIKQTSIKLYEIKISNLSFLNICKIFKISSIFKKNTVKTILINLSSDLKIAGLAAKNAKVKNIIYRRGSAIPIKLTKLNKFYFSKIITSVIANTNETKKTINQNAELIDENKIKVIYNGIKLKEFDQIKFELYQKNQNEIIIGNIGRFVKQKAQYLLIDLAEILKQKNIKFKIYIGGDGYLEEELKKLVNKKELKNEIIFTGFVENTKEFIENIDIFVLTSEWEGFGYVLVEAMACKKTVIAFNISSNPEIIENNETGYLIEHKDLEKLSEKIIYLSKNKNLLEEMGNKGRKRAEELFTFEQSYKNLLLFFKELE